MKTKHDLKELHNFIELMSDLVFIKNFKGQYTHINKAFLTFINKSREDVLFKTDYDLFNKEDASRFRKIDLEILENKIDLENMEEQIVKDDNGISYFNISKQILYDLEDNEVGLFCVARNITIRKEYELIYEDNKSLLEYIAIENDLEKILTKIISLAEERNEDTKCSILLLDKSKKHLLKGAAPSLPDFYNEAINGVEIGEKIGSCGSAAYKKQRVIIENIDTHENWQPYLELTRKANLHACWSEPIISSNNEVLGTFAIYNSIYKAPSEFELKLISSYSNMASIAIEKDNVYKKVLENEYQLSQLFNNTQSGLIYINNRRKIIKANKRFAEIFGYKSVDEIIGRKTSDFHISKSSNSNFKKQFALHLKDNELFNIEYKFKKKDGTIIWCELSGKVLDKTLPIELTNGVLWTINDISLRKSYEIKLRDSELLNKNILETIPDMIWLKDTNGKYLMCNHEFEKFFGAKKEDIINKTDYEFKDKKTSDEFRLNDKLAMKASGSLINEEWVSYPSSKQQVLLDTTKKAMHDHNGKIIGVLGIGHDVTKRKEQLDKLEELNKLAKSLTDSQANLLSLFDKGDSVLFEWKNNSDWDIEYISTSIYKLLGYKKEEVLQNHFIYSKFIHKDDIKKVREEVKNALSNNLDYFKHEPYRIFHKNGDIKWVLDYTVMKKDENEKVTHFIGYITDITEQKKQQDIIFQQTKLASMGEMIGNIAHQWRQPLSIISSIATASKIEKELDILSNEDFYKHMEIINKNTQYLSETIDNFRQFIKANREISDFNLTNTIKSFLNVVHSSIIKSDLKVVLDLDDNIIMQNYQNDIIQAFINIINNSIDAFEQSSKDEKYFFITSRKEDEKILIKIKDNAGGIDEKLIKKVFEPYTTSKYQSLGTGLGLNITYNFIVEGMKGKIVVENSNYIYKDKKYKGCEFTITFDSYSR
ncbi:PAS domain S-box protein [Poseidonibacter ostreae]|jgi:PAS domain S-box-containing protein|uniref:histidine kinase n=1 Tax=Poseidonibacter ostreae TaxID=2654171 RepID=A0ABQ6VKB1_9BACT|nr:PAS domain S-box protein [Poseidonibacter ostreae]KAB7887343.1 PAS domain S-box protein [Poseidonibacter ostreae]KAB7890232.1 PAS domain S-box protein [Poseidonibacter ostreae]|tara:strand:+ start:2992 stop:5796 length:2805 start_codon:yes stop_codon:yes gene_type:complete